MLQPSNGYAMLLCLVKNQTAIRTSVANIQRCATAPFCSLSQFQIMIKAEQKWLLESAKEKLNKI